MFARRGLPILLIIVCANVRVRNLISRRFLGTRDRPVTQSNVNVTSTLAAEVHRTRHWYQRSAESVNRRESRVTSRPTDWLGQKEKSRIIDTIAPSFHFSLFFLFLFFYKYTCGATSALICILCEIRDNDNAVMSTSMSSVDSSVTKWKITINLAAQTTSVKLFVMFSKSTWLLLFFLMQQWRIARISRQLSDL